MGKKGEQQDELFVPYSQMRSAGHPFVTVHGADGSNEGAA